MVTRFVPYAISSYKVIVHEAEEGGFWGEVLELPGCVSQGETIDEFRRNIREALEAVLESESQSSRIEVYLEPISAEKDFIGFDILESREGAFGWVEATKTWTSPE